MALRDVLVYLDRSDHSASRLDLAARLAARQQATLIGMRIEVHPHIPETFRAAIRPDALAAQADLIAQDTGRIEAALRAAAAQAGVRAEWWCERGGGIAELCRRARYADVTVVSVPPRDREEELSSRDLVHELLFTTGRSVLLVPDPVGPGVVGRRIVLAWNSSRESSRALAEAMPLLVAAEAVAVVTVCAAGDRAKLGDMEEAARHLVRNGVKATAVPVEGVDHDAGDRLLAAARDFGADLLVMGAYGRSRMREMVLGGATWHIIRNAGIPVLMAH